MKHLQGMYSAHLRAAHQRAIKLEQALAAHSCQVRELFFFFSLFFYMPTHLFQLVFVHLVFVLLYERNVNSIISEKF